MKTIFTKESSGFRALLLSVLAIVLMILDMRMTTLSHVRSALSVALMPLQYAVSWPIQWFDNVSKMVSTHNQLVSENFNLKAEQLVLRAQVQRLLALESENEELKALKRSSAQYQGKMLVAELVAVDVDPFIHQMVINKGSSSGVFIGQPVLDAYGVMGKIIHAAPYTSRVLLLNDPHSGIPVQVARNGVRAIVMGDNYTGKLKLVNVPQTADIQNNDILVTSGLGQHFPEGYPVGKVRLVIKDPGLQFATIHVDPSAKLDRAREVLLIWPDQQITEATPHG